MNNLRFLPTALAFQNQLVEINIFFKKHKLRLNTQHALILEVLNTYGMLTQQEIAVKLLKDKSSIARFIPPILNNGLVSILVDCRDKRKKIVKITDAGVASLTSLYDHINISDGAFLEQRDSSSVELTKTNIANERHVS